MKIILSHFHIYHNHANLQSFANDLIPKLTYLIIRLFRYVCDEKSGD